VGGRRRKESEGRWVRRNSGRKGGGGLSEEGRRFIGSMRRRGKREVLKYIRTDAGYGVSRWD
jgi:hypothetical protein